LPASSQLTSRPRRAIGQSNQANRAGFETSREAARPPERIGKQQNTNINLSSFVIQGNFVELQVLY
jgi:hypothetical protein